MFKLLWIYVISHLHNLKLLITSILQVESVRVVLLDVVYSFVTSCWMKVPFIRSLVIYIGVSSQKGGCCGGTLRYMTFSSSVIHLSFFTSPCAASGTAVLPYCCVYMLTKDAN